MSQEKRQKQNHTDRRVKRTKKALHDALFELLETKTIDQVTVTELTALADVNRATFYFYYTDLKDMLQQIEDETYKAFMNVLTNPTERIDTPESFASYAKRLLDFCKEHETLCRFIIHNEANNPFYKTIQNHLMSNFPHSKSIYAENNTAKYCTTFCLSGITGILIEWMKDGMTIPTEELADYFASLYFNGPNKSRQMYSSNKLNN